MPRLKLLAWIPLNALVLAACGEGATPTQPEAVGESTSAAALASNTWTPRAPFPRPHSAFSAGAAPNAAGQWIAYVFGGRDEDGTGFPGYAYNVVTDTWTANGAFSRAADMNGVGKIGNKFYFTGGQSCCDETFQTFNTTWSYEPAANRLVQRADMPKATRAGVTGVIDGKLYVLPGSCSGEPVDPGHCETFTFLRQLYRYDPATDTWTTRRQAPHFHTFGGAAVLDGKFYVVGPGQTGDLDVYDPATNTWRTLAPIPTPGERLFAAPLQGKIFVLSWSHPNGSPIILKAYLYDPATNTWKSRAAPPGVAGPIVTVKLDGRSRLFMPGSESSYLYTP